MTRPEVMKLEYSLKLKKAQWLAACGHMSTSSQSMHFILSLRLYSSLITLGLGYTTTTHCRPAPSSVRKRQITLTATKQQEDDHSKAMVSFLIAFNWMTKGQD